MTVVKETRLVSPEPDAWSLKSRGWSRGRAAAIPHKISSNLLIPDSPAPAPAHTIKIALQYFK